MRFCYATKTQYGKSMTQEEIATIQQLMSSGMMSYSEIRTMLQDIKKDKIEAKPVQAIGMDIGVGNSFSAINRMDYGSSNQAGKAIAIDTRGAGARDDMVDALGYIGTVTSTERLPSPITITATSLKEAWETIGKANKVMPVEIVPSRSRVKEKIESNVDKELSKRIKTGKRKLEF